MVNKISKSSIKSEELVEAKKREFFHETLILTLKEPEISFKIQRFRLTPEFAQHLIDRTIHSHGVTLAFLKASDERNGIVVPSEMQRLCNKSISYEMVLEYPKQTKDVDKCYQGQLHFVIKGLPDRSQNHLHEVRSHHVTKWIEDGTLKEDPDLVQLERVSFSLNKSLLTLNEQIAKAHEYPIMNDRGLEIKGKVAELKRQERYNKMLKSKHRIQDEIKANTKAISEMRYLKSQQIKLSAAKLNPNMWTIDLHGEYKSLYEQIILNKASWNTSFMYACPKGASGEQQQDMNEYLVDTASASIERVEHGFGIYHSTNESEACENQCINFYHGTYVDGKYHGSGMLYLSNYIYGGGFEDKLPSGKGVLIYKDGDVLKSDQFGVNNSLKDQFPINRYTRGDKPGESRISFSDGASYVGGMHGGAISGQGVYTSASG